MNYKIFLLALCFFAFSCKKEQPSTTENNWTQVSSRIKYRNDNQSLELESGKFNYKIPTSKLPFKKVVLLNSSLTGYFLELGAENRIIGISSPEFVYSDKIHQLIKEQKIANIGNEQKYDVEKIIALKPDVIFTNYIETFENTYDVLKKAGIEIIFIDDYLEQNPLQKAKIIEVFGKLFGMDHQAHEIYSKVEKNYKEIATLAAATQEKPVIISNEMYGSQWFLPGGKTSTAAYFKDANTKYILQNSTDEKSVPLTFEEVFVKSKDAKYWVNLSDYTNRKQMLAINPNYAKMNIFQTGKLYSLYGKVKGSGNDFFESGNVRPDIVLKDYVKIFHPELFPNYSLTYMKAVN